MNIEGRLVPSIPLREHDGLVKASFNRNTLLTGFIDELPSWYAFFTKYVMIAEAVSQELSPNLQRSLLSCAYPADRSPLDRKLCLGRG